MFPEQSVRHEKISIHALREEGDTYRLVRLAKFDEFLSTPSARRATHPCRGAIPAGSISIHALREEGDRATARRYPFSGDFYPRPPRGGRRSRWRRSWWHQQFLSTPSARRATERPCASSRSCHISIHALREEGDTECICRIHQMHQYFYPRPPRGGRRGRCRFRAMPYPYFYPRPPRGGRRAVRDKLRPAFRISIHALREEGDGKHRRTSHPQQDFYPRPPRGGRPKEIYAQGNTADISIHALREEGDPRKSMHRATQRIFLSTPSARRATANIGEQAILNKISIHALREEGDGIRAQPATAASRFLSTPSARRATRAHCNGHRHYQISIHALREEGDGIRL